MCGPLTIPICNENFNAQIFAFIEIKYIVNAKPHAIEALHMKYLFLVHFVDALQ